MAGLQSLDLSTISLLPSALYQSPNHYKMIPRLRDLSLLLLALLPVAPFVAASDAKPDYGVVIGIGE